MPNTFCERLAELRSKSGLSQQKFAAILNLTKSALSNYENGSREPNYDTLVQIANNLNVSIDYLLGRTDDSRPFKGKTQPGRAYDFPYKEILKLLKEDHYTLGGRPIPNLQKLMLQIPLETIQKIVKGFKDEEEAAKKKQQEAEKASAT